MMVDDDKAILAMGRVMLKDKYEVFPLPSAAKLFDILEKVTPDIILLDIKMPEIDGIEALKRLKADSRYSKIPVIFVTSIDDDRSVFEHLKHGAYSSVGKPFSAPELHSRIENCLNDFFPSETVIKEEDKKTMVVFDDTPVESKLIQLVMREEFNIRKLSDPGKLKDLLQEITPDVFLLDNKKPAQIGAKLVPVIRENPKFKDTPILFLQHEKTSECQAEAMRLGVCDFIIKPIKVEPLRKTIAKYVIKK